MKMKWDGLKGDLSSRAMMIAVAAVFGAFSTSPVVVAQCDVWQAMGGGLDAQVDALALYEGNLIAGGTFTTAGGRSANHIARWDGSAWHPLGSGMNDNVHALTLYIGDLIAGGDFTSAGGQSASRVARWNGSAWQPLASGLDGSVQVLATNSWEMIAGGLFTTAGGETANFIARWDNYSWQPLGIGVSGDVRALTVHNGDVVAGGSFTTAGGQSANFIARWNGFTWQPLGSGMNGPVLALTTYNGQVIAGGTFTTAGGQSANYIARWNGSTWQPLGNGMNGPVRALAVYEGELIAGGEFNDAGGLSANHVARWNGGFWQTMGTGVNDEVMALTAGNDELVAGGAFTTAAWHFANRIARWAAQPPISPCSGDITADGAVDVLDLLSVINTWGQCPLPPQDCPADIAPNGGDGHVSVHDLLAVINGWGPCSVYGVCALPSEICCSLGTYEECIAAGGLGWVNTNRCVDTDNDRIADVFELNDCSEPALPYLGTDPNLADTDGDGLSDGDEAYGTVSGLDLAALGCSPLRKDLLMEVDWFDDSIGFVHSHRPSDAAISAMVAAFANAPVTNVCGGPGGITLIIDYGQGGQFTGGNLIPGGDTVVVFSTEFYAYKAENFAANRHGYFYYAIHCHDHTSPNNPSSGIAELGGDDHIVSLKTALSDSNVSKTMMHELGHNLGLQHGGFEFLNWKPNYNSIMNYRYSFAGVDTDCNGVGNGGLDYSRNLNPPLDENALSEAAGICSGVGIDWNGNGLIDPGLIMRNIKCGAGVSLPCGSISGLCCSSDCSSACWLLLDHDDWGSIVFTGLLDADFAPQIVACEPPVDAPRDP